MIAALYVETNGCYFGIEGVDPWDEDRDARAYPGPHPVIAHPPCQRWGRFWAGSPSYIARTGIRKVKGDDGGCFEAALRAVRVWGGVLEHPYGSHALKHFGIAQPPREGGWIHADNHGGWICCVERGRYGHWMRKPTVLLAYNTERPELDWGISIPTYPGWAIERYGLAKCKRMGEIAFKGGGVDNRHRIGTPVQFRELLMNLARSAANK